MERHHSELFAPYRSIGVVTGNVAPSIRSVFVNKKSTLSILCPIDNVILQYNGKKLRAIGSSNPFPSKVTAIASSSSCVYAAHSKTISALPFCRNVTDSMEIDEEVRMMTLVGTKLIAIDKTSGINVIETENKLESILNLEGSENFEISAVVHPNTYLNKIVVGSTEGRLRIVNIRTGKVVHEFQKEFGSKVTFLEQTPALDVVAVGLSSGKVILYNIKMDKVLHTFSHDSEVTKASFRDDGEPTMVTADVNGTLAVWNLEKQELIGKLTGVHTAAVNCLYFVPGEPIMVSASHDNSLRLWIFDGADGMPRELVRLDGHKLAASSVHFTGKTQVLSAGHDGSIRKYDVTSLTMRQKLGNVALKNDVEPMHKVEEIAVGWQREAAWNNVFCRENGSTKITPWQSRNNTRGSFVLEHERFRNKVEFVAASASAICLSPCGNFVFIGYSSGHIDQFNAQSGRYINSFSSTPSSKSSKIHKKSKDGRFTYRKTSKKSDDKPAVAAKITSLSVDQRGKELMSTDETGYVQFWSLATRQVTAKLFKKHAKLGLSSASPTNSLVAVVAKDDTGSESIVLIDSVCHKVVRGFEKVGQKVNALTFSSDGRWLLVADCDGYIRVFDVATSHLIDVIGFSQPCVSMSFNETGEYLATVHQDERAVYIWANKSLFLSHVNIRALDPDFLPNYEISEDSPDICIDDDEDSIMDEEIRAMRALQLDENAVTFSGLPLSRWVNLPDLAMIKERNKPTTEPKKIKQAPFFLSATQTLEGFDFQPDEFGIDDGESRILGKSKRDLLELESSFSTLLKKCKTNEDLIAAFGTLQDMTISSIDFQIRSLNPSTLPIFLRMLLVVLKTKKSFELVQAYLTTALKIHRSEMWKKTADEELSSVLNELSQVQKVSWNEMENLFVENVSIVQWIKNALL